MEITDTVHSVLINTLLTVSKYYITCISICAHANFTIFAVLVLFNTLNCMVYMV